MEENPQLFEIFLQIQSGLPRQGPGSQQSTLKALSYCAGLPNEVGVLDIGCGPGMQTITLANALNCNIMAVDVVDEYLSILKQNAQKENLTQRITILNRDMNDLGFGKESFDLIWAEGSAYIMGFENALDYWKTFLKPASYIAISELVWLKDNPPADLSNFFKNEYPPMTNLENNLSIIETEGYEITGHFTLPDSDWWDNYYAPLEAKLPALTEQFKDDKEALSILEMTRAEIDMRRRYSDFYGYEFFIAKKA
ncbi:MAG: class I SAM-dependent methyltransferase [Thermodesulfobacteriota bacterium]